MKSSNKKPTVISTFAGCGGSSLGYRWAGFRELLAIDFEDHAVQSYRDNFPGVPVWQRDVRDVTGAEIMKACGIAKGELDVFDGSPPCQGFSTSAPGGKRDVADARNDLSFHFARLLKELQPKAFVMENVPGMLKGKMKGVFPVITKAVADAGYVVSVREINAANHGVPQARHRLIWIGARKDLGIVPTFPQPLSTPPQSVGQAIADLPEDRGRTLSPMGMRIWRQLKPGESFREKHPKGHWFNAYKIDPNRPGNTVVKSCSKTGNSGLYHHRFPRILNIAECKRVCSFPDDFILRGSFEEQWARLGNAVMPRLMQRIAEHVRVSILDSHARHPQRRNDTRRTDRRT